MSMVLTSPAVLCPGATRRRTCWLRSRVTISLLQLMCFPLMPLTHAKVSEMLQIPFSYCLCCPPHPQMHFPFKKDCSLVWEICRNSFSIKHFFFQTSLLLFLYFTSCFLYVAQQPIITKSAVFSLAHFLYKVLHWSVFPAFTESFSPPLHGELEK